MTAKGDTYGIWYEPTQKNFEPGWVLDDSYSAAVYSSERSARKDIKEFVHPNQYQVRPHRRGKTSVRSRRSRT
tara:strand:- start:432 stop:650 length:219 start_codon:yes stop_codon:yes gene_type:complete